jgi:hypothetical protein
MIFPKFDNDVIDVPLGEEIKIGIVAKSGISQEDVSWFEKIPKRPPNKNKILCSNLVPKFLY